MRVISKRRGLCEKKTEEEEDHSVVNWSQVMER